MKYIIFADDGKEYGPVDVNTLRRWVESGRVLPHTQVRNVIVKRWHKASELDFLKEAFELQSKKAEKSKSTFEQGIDLIKSILTIKKVEKKEKSTAFKFEFIPDPAPIILRIMSFIFDLFLILSFTFILMLIFSIAIKAGWNLNTTFDLLVLTLYTAIVLYYGICLGVFAQTFGMWFWGIMIVNREGGEVFLGRAYFHTLMMLLLGLVAPFIVYLNPDKRSLHEIISGTKIVRISAKPKA